jgi:hypothetical protein
MAVRLAPRMSSGLSLAISQVEPVTRAEKCGCLVMGPAKMDPGNSCMVASATATQNASHQLQLRTVMQILLQVLIIPYTPLLFAIVGAFQSFPNHSYLRSLRHTSE